MAVARKFCPEVCSRLIEHLRESKPPMHRDTAAALVGIHKATLKNWIDRGGKELEGIEQDLQDHPEVDAALSPHAEFYVRAIMAEAEAKRDLDKEMWNDHGEATKDVIARCKWWLERRYPALHGKASQHILTGPEGGPIEVDPVAALMSALAPAKKEEPSAEDVSIDS